MPGTRPGMTYESYFQIFIKSEMIALKFQFYFQAAFSRK